MENRLLSTRFDAIVIPNHAFKPYRAVNGVQVAFERFNSIRGDGSLAQGVSEPACGMPLDGTALRTWRAPRLLQALLHLPRHVLPHADTQIPDSQGVTHPPGRTRCRPPLHLTPRLSQHDASARRSWLSSSCSKYAPRLRWARAAIDVDVGLERRSPRYHETGLSLESVEESSAAVSKPRCVWLRVPVSPESPRSVSS